MVNHVVILRTSILEEGVVCRLCLKRHEYSLNIFSWNTTRGMLIQNVIQDLLNVEVVEDDGLPDTVCRTCVRKLTEFSEFREMCINSAAELQKIVLKSILQVDLKEEDDSSESLSDEETNQREFVDKGGPQDRAVDVAEDVPREMLAVTEADRGANVDEDETKGREISSVVAVPFEERNLVNDKSMTRGISDANENVLSRSKVEGRGTSIKTRSKVRHVSPVHSPKSDLMKKCQPRASKIVKLRESKCFKDTSKLNNLKKAEKRYKLRHLDFHEKNLLGGKGYICDYCGINYPDKNKLTIHIRGHISRKSTIISAMPKKYFSKRCTKTTPRKRDEVLKPFKCEKCGKAFRHNSWLLEHLVIHTGFRAYKCDTCENKFFRKSDLSKHSVLHSKVKPFKCEICGKEFNFKCNLTEHLPLHSGLKPFKCGTCGKVFPRKYDLVKHCVVHSTLKPFKCEKCGKGFARKNDVHKHSVIHSNVKAFKCVTCEKTFTRKKDLAIHVHIHTGFRAYKCETCGKQFKRSNHLKLHMATHTGLRPFKCEACGKAFTQRSVLRRHSVSRACREKFKCEACEMTFDQKGKLLAHSVIHTSSDKLSRKNPAGK